MINQLLKGFVDLIYGTAQVRKNYQLNNPVETVMAADASKGIVTTDNQEIKRGIDWVTSQRAVILLTDRNIICGKWKIPLENIANAQLSKINSLFGSGQVLKIQTKDNINYQFGMQINPEWTTQQIVPLTLVREKVKYSAFSIIVRLFLIGYILYWCYEKFIVN